MKAAKQLRNGEFQKKYGPWAVVAGASEGLGAQFAEHLARRGLDLVLIARRAELLQTLAARLRQDYHVEVLELPLDLASPYAPAQIVRATAALDIGLLVYNAAYSSVGSFLESPIEDHLKEIDTNVRTPLLLIHAFGLRFANRRCGGILMMSSLSAFQGSAMIANYAATKAYSLLLGEGLWEEWRNLGVDVLVCLASAIKTPGYLASRPRQSLIFSTPASDPGEVAAAALDALGKQPTVIPGVSNRMASFFMRRLLPRRTAIRLMGRVMRGMYPRKT
jgi:short-subunit dehydrogenase